MTPGGGLLTSRLTFSAVAGTRYLIAVDGYFGATGTIRLEARRLSDAPAPHLGNLAIEAGAGGKWSLRLNPSEARTMIISSSDDLIRWVPVLTNQMTLEPFRWELPLDPGSTSRFYRVESGD